MRARTISVVLVILVGLVGASCAAGEPGTQSLEPAPTTSAQRAARVETSGCGWASARTGSGVAIEDGIVVTVAHLVARADTVEVALGDDRTVDAVVAAVDYERDLALLRVPTLRTTRAELAPMSPDGEHDGLVVGGATSGTVAFAAKRPARISIEEVLGTDRHARLGYELDAATARGDSGAGVYDSRDRLLGIVFATSDDGATTWATAVSEVMVFLDENRAATDPFRCDAAASALRLSD